MEFILNNIAAYLIVIGACRFAIYWIGIVTEKFINFLIFAVMSLNVIMLIDLVNWCATKIPAGGNLFDMNGYIFILIIIFLLYFSPFAFYGSLLKYRLIDFYKDPEKLGYFNIKLVEKGIAPSIINTYYVFFFNEKQIDRAINRIEKTAPKIGEI